MRSFFIRLALALATCAHAAHAAHAAQVSVAVAANFAGTMQQIAHAFERATGHAAVLSVGSTGRFYAQVRNGAPYDVLLAADEETPRRLEHEGAAVPGSRFTYATGRLVLWSATPGFVDERGEVLRSGRYARLAIADPKLAPYGAAAMQVLQQLGLADAVRAKRVEAESVGQAFQFVDSGNAQLGFVALSQVASGGRIERGSGWIVPASLHAPLRQDAVLLLHGRDNPAARALLQFLRGGQALAIVRASGYDI